MKKLKSNPLGTKNVTRVILEGDPKNRKERRALSSKKAKPKFGDRRL